MPPRSTSMRLVATAHHEAGHAVVSHVLGRRIKVVTIVPQGQSIGRMTNVPLRSLEAIEFRWDQRMRVQCEAEIMIFFAGKIAEQKHRGSRVRYGHDHDFQAIAGLLVRMSPHGEPERNAYGRWLFERTVALVGNPNHWRAIERLATALVEQSTVKGRDAHALVDDVLRPPHIRQSDAALKAMAKRLSRR